MCCSSFNKHRGIAAKMAYYTCFIFQGRRAVLFNGIKDSVGCFIGNGSFHSGTVSYGVHGALILWKNITRVSQDDN